VQSCTFYYVDILLEKNCHDGLQNVILDPGWIHEHVRLSRNIIGQDTRSCVLRPAKPFSPHAVASANGVDVLCPTSATALVDILMMLQKVDVIG
jgi:hypothetical protein